VTRFQPQLEAAEYEVLHRWSVEDPEEFWSGVWDFAAIVGDKGAGPFLQGAARFPGARWFPQARLNYAENLLRRCDDAVALVGLLENGERTELSYSQLHRRVAALAAALRRDSVTVGDRVAGYLPNVIDTVVAMLATTSIGAIWSSCSPDFGSEGLLDRFGQIEPKVLFVADGYFYNGREHDALARVAPVLTQLTSLRRVVIVPVTGATHAARQIPNAVEYADYPDYSAGECTFERLPFDHPLFIMFSSGTTGRPKCIVHSAGGALLEHQKEHLLHTDIGPDDVFFYFTTCGWMMWNWLVSGLATGCTVVLYDGSPAWPDPDSAISLIDREKITVFGASARYLSALQSAESRPAQHLDLGSLRTILSTGSPLSAACFRYVYEHIKSDVLLASISGGTDLLGAFVSGNPCLPVYAGELQCKGLGFDIDVVDENGETLRRGQGELVCRRPFPSVPVGFWNDVDNHKFHAAYFERFAGIWAHGDFAEFTSHHGMLIHGRSDAVLNPGGVRIGTAEIYRQLEHVPAVVDAVVVEQKRDGDSRVVLFVKLRPGQFLDNNMRDRVKSVIRANATPRHVPDVILEVADIPRTRSGKTAELAVRNVVNNQPVDNTTALENPESLLLFNNLAGLRG